MKTLLIFCLIFFALEAAGQDSLQQVRLKSLQGKIGLYSGFVKKDSLVLICFWSVASEESITELNSINVNLEKWQALKAFRFMAVSIDESKAASRMRPIYNMNGWTFDSYVDLYGELRKALHSNNIPQSIIVFKNEVIYEQSGWTEGSENYLIQRLTSLK